jgi:hypothetical protein
VIDLSDSAVYIALYYLQAASYIVLRLRKAVRPSAPQPTVLNSVF